MKDKNRVDVMVGDILRAETLPNDWVVLYHSGDGGVAIRDIVTGEPGGAFFSDAWEVIRRADGSDPRPSALSDAEANKFKGALQAAIDAPLDTGDWAALTSALRLLHKPLPRQPHELYAEFHRVVTETVKARAPRASVVTDFSGRTGLMWLSLNGESVQRRMPLSSLCIEKSVVEAIDTLRDNVGVSACFR